MPDFLAGWPFWVVFVVLYLGATARGQMIYWLGRWATHLTVTRTHPTGGWQARAHGWLSGEGPQRGVDALRRWGLVMVPIGYLTVGFQSMIQAGAGILRIAWWKYSIAQVPGALAWAAIYSTIGFAVWGALIAAFAGSPLGLLVIAALLVVGFTTFALHRRARRRSADATPADTLPADTLPADGDSTAATTPADALPADATPADALTADATPADGDSAAVTTADRGTTT
ncbi:DedA family protein [Georgenia sp. Z1344]|uniref:DedA family protein n=1 Tax=Georgenia sp. Z1344 TaxID=3416706 RepID=UPI003CEC47B3